MFLVIALDICCLKLVRQNTGSRGQKAYNGRDYRNNYSYTSDVKRFSAPYRLE